MSSLCGPIVAPLSPVDMMLTPTRSPSERGTSPRKVNVTPRRSPRRVSISPGSPSRRQSIMSPDLDGSLRAGGGRSRQNSIFDGVTLGPNTAVAGAAGSDVTPTTAALSRQYLKEHSDENEDLHSFKVQAAVRDMKIAARARKLHHTIMNTVKPHTPAYVKRNTAALKGAAQPARWKKTKKGDWVELPEGTVSNVLQQEHLEVTEEGDLKLVDARANDVDDDPSAESLRASSRQSQRMGTKKGKPHSRLPGVSIAPLPPVEQQHALAENKSAPGGVQQAWESSSVQMGPFRRLVAYAPSTERRTPSPIRADSPGPGVGAIPRGISVTPDLRPPSSLAPVRVAIEQQEQLRQKRAATPFLNSSVSQQSPSSNEDRSAMKFSIPFMLSMLPRPCPEVKHRSTLPAKNKAHKCVDGCPHCDDVAKQIDAFDAVRTNREDTMLTDLLEQERADAEAAAEAELQKGMSSFRRTSTVSSPTNASNVGSPTAVTYKGAVGAVKAVDRLKVKVTRTKNRQAYFSSDGEGPTIAQLYHGMTHRDREDLYISVVGGLSFDLTRERFSYLIHRVLAPRIHATVTDEHIHTMFNVFDINQGGTVSYFEYLSALCHALLAADQAKFLNRLFELLHELQYQEDQMALMNRSGTRQSRVLSTVMGGPASPAPRKSRVASVIPSRRSSVGSTAGDLPEEEESPRTIAERASKPKPKRHEVLLTRRHLSYARLRRAVFSLRNHSMLFPHPEEDDLAKAMDGCFNELQPGDKVTHDKYLMFCFCDDDVMAALSKLIPPLQVQLPNGTMVKVLGKPPSDDD